jgi:transposase
VDLRELKGLEIAARCRIGFRDGAWLVPAQTGAGTYQVLLSREGDGCECEDFQLHRLPCKHIHAARLVRERDHRGQAPVLHTDALPKRKTYRQNWPAYNLAQTTEKHRLQVLLHELCQGLSEPVRAPRRAGRKPVPLADRVFACAFKIYSTVSSRRFACDLQEAHHQGYLSRPLHPNKVNHFLEDPALAPVLGSLILRSSLPLRALETEFAGDSSGFSTSRFVRWYDEKYGLTRSGKDWVKVHIMCGVKTNVVTAVEILDKDAGDSPQLPALVETTARNFTVKEVSLDKAYLSHDNLALIAGLGATPFIPFKSNSQAGEEGSLWAKMFHFFQFQREQFLMHYHLRSNVESTFSMVKAKFRDHVRSKSDPAMVNEVLCKFLCHNICCVIAAHCELGIEATFWDQEPEEDRPGVLPMVRPE